MTTILQVINRREGTAYVQAECDGCKVLGPRVECGLKYDHDAVTLARTLAGFFEHSEQRRGKRGQPLRGRQIVGWCRECATAQRDHMITLHDEAAHGRLAGAGRSTGTLAPRAELLRLADEIRRLCAHLDQGPAANGSARFITPDFETDE